MTVKRLFDPDLKKKSLEIINHGICCNCLVFLYKTKFWRPLIKGETIHESDLNLHSSIFTAIRSILITLQTANIIHITKEGFRFSDLGLSLGKHIGLINMLFEGYGPLMACQSDIAKGKVINPSNLLNGKSIAESSISFGESVDPIIIKELLNFSFSGTICDLGCGACTRLSKVCELSGHPGLGFDNESEVIEVARNNLASSDTENISVECKDIINLEGIWEDVVVLMQYFVFHDFTPENKCARILNSYLDNFPNLKCFFYVDIVAPSPNHPEIMPGYDYVHGLLGIKTRTYEETISMFEKSKYKIEKEIPLEQLPNTFIWILSRK